MYCTCSIAGCRNSAVHWIWVGHSGVLKKEGNVCETHMKAIWESVSLAVAQGACVWGQALPRYPVLTDEERIHG